jgi:hypothetical protein
MKIKIYCTTQEELQINNKKINLKNYNKLNEKPDKFEFVSKIFLLQKYKFINNKTTYIRKSLEFICNRDITEEEFIMFIENLKKIGFTTKKDELKIRYIDNEGKIVFNYNFTTNKPLIIPAFSNKKKSLYKQQNLYIRHYEN